MHIGMYFYLSKKLCELVLPYLFFPSFFFFFLFFSLTDKR